MGLLMVLVIVSRLAVAADATTNDSDLLRTSHLSRLAEWVHKDYRMQKHFQTLLREPHFLQPDGEKSGLVGAYFANMNFEGTPAFTRVDREVRLDRKSVV